MLKNIDSKKYFILKNIDIQVIEFWKISITKISNLLKVSNPNPSAVHFFRMDYSRDANFPYYIKQGILT